MSTHLQHLVNNACSAYGHQVASAVLDVFICREFVALACTDTFASGCGLRRALSGKQVCLGYASACSQDHRIMHTSHGHALTK